MTCPGLVAQLKAAILASRKSAYQIAQESGVDQMSISRFMAGKRDFRLETAEKLAGVVGMTLAPVQAKRRT